MTNFVNLWIDKKLGHAFFGNIRQSLNFIVKNLIGYEELLNE